MECIFLLQTLVWFAHCVSVTIPFLEQSGDVHTFSKSPTDVPNRPAWVMCKHVWRAIICTWLWLAPILPHNCKEYIERHCELLLTLFCQGTIKRKGFYLTSSQVNKMHFEHGCAWLLHIVNPKTASQCQAMHVTRKSHQRRMHELALKEGAYSVISLLNETNLPRNWF